LPVQVAQWIVVLVISYVGMGILVAPFVIYRGYAHFDPGISESTRGFRLLILPGAVLLWPILLGRFLQATGVPPTEQNSHRARAREKASES